MKNHLFKFFFLIVGGTGFLHVGFAGDFRPETADFVAIKSGSFFMGSPEGEVGRKKDEVLHKVTISYDFEVQKTHVTQKQWFDVMGTNPSRFRHRDHCPKDFESVGESITLCPFNPVTSISWKMAQEFIKKLNESQTEYFYRLPTEAEWEYAARAGTTTAIPFEGALEEYAWTYKNSKGQTHSVGQFSPNRWGLYDVMGNAWQLIQDYYGPYPAFPVVDPTGPSSSSSGNIVWRGGSAVDDTPPRSALRDYDRVNWVGIGVGFRLVRLRNE